MDDWGEVLEALTNITDSEGNIYYPVLGGTTDEKNGFYSRFEIDKDLFEKKVCKAILVEVDNQPAGFLLYSYIYWANRGKGIYLSQAYVKETYRQQGLLKQLLEEVVNQEKDIKFITDYVGQENETMIKAMGKLEFKTSDLMVYYKLN